MQEEQYERLLEQAVCQMGNLTRWNEKLKQLQYRDVTIAYVGGSITQGVGAKDKKSCYAYTSYEALKELLVTTGKLSVECSERLIYHNAGLAGTGSQSCGVRYEKDVEADGIMQPDIVVVEFAVNDGEDETQGVFYESLIRRILNKDNKPAILLVFSVFENGYNLQQRLTPIATHYNLPLINIKQGIYSQFSWEQPVLTKEQYFADPLHPSDVGHKFMKDCLCSFFKKSLQEDEVQENFVCPEEVVYGNDAEKICLLDRSHPYNGAKIFEGAFQQKDIVLQDGSFPDNWAKPVCTSDNQSFCMEIQASVLIVVVKDSDNPNFGKMEIYVDDEFCRFFDPHIEGWVHCHPLLLYRNKPGKHKVEIRMQQGEESMAGTILGFGYCKNI
ncbi:MAG: SGNH/GDSL hydrolase family protein [Lachnospiraceae bacterium]|nr:SGNH/GDSL hydrolase family protein [Lachnospiraceae bacterium]